jgi:hypothetical protein
VTEDEFQQTKRINGGRFFIPKREPTSHIEPKLTITKRITAEVHEYRYFNDYPKFFPRG